MELAYSELPLAIFSTLGPVGAGAFVVIALLAAKPIDDAHRAKLDKLSFVAFAVVVVGMIGAFGHLANPLHAPFVFARALTSPLSREIVVAVMFLAVALLYCIFAAAGKLQGDTRTVCAVLVAVLGAAFAVFIGLAYFMDTITTWNTPLTVIELVGAFFLGGSLLGAVFAVAAGCFDEVKVPVAAISVIGALSFAGALAAHLAMASGITSRLADGADLVMSVMPLAVCAIAGSIVAAALALGALKAKKPMAFLGFGCVVAIIAIFTGRLAFYGIQMSAGLFM